jgi:hypothetical protein
MYETSSPSSRFVGDAAKTVYGASGVTLSLSVSSGTSWSGTLTGTISGDESGIMLSAQQSISASVTYSKTTTVSLGGSWTVPSNQSSGWLALGSMGYHFNWAYVHENGNCTVSTIRSGVATLPAQSPFIDHS